MRILVLTSTFPRWAGDREPPFVFELCRRLAESHDVLVLAPHCRGAAREERLDARLRVRRFRYAPERLETLAYEGGILEKLRRARWRWLLVPLFFLAEWRATRRAIRHEQPDVIHAHWLVPQGVIAHAARLGSARPTLVCTSHGADLFALRGALATRLKRWTARHVSALTVVSAAMKSEAIRLGADAQNVAVMPMGIDARARFTPDASRRSDDELLFVGRLVPKKGVEHLLRALPMVRRSVPARLTLIGAGPLEGELRALALALGVGACVDFVGAVPNDKLAGYYRRATALVVPSVVTQQGDQEGLGLVIAEALACECPVVASDLAAIADIVRDGVTGVLARAADATDLADKIVRLLADPARAAALGRRGRALVLERFDWQIIGGRYEDLLSALAA